MPNPNVGAYGASKAAVHSIGLTLSRKLNVANRKSCESDGEGYH